MNNSVIVFIYELVVTIVILAVAVTVTVVNVVRIVIKYVVAVVIPSSWPEDPARVDVAAVITGHVAVPVRRTVVAN